MPASAPPGTLTFQPMGNSSSTGFSSTFNTKGFKPADKALIHQWTLAQFHENSLNPTVTATEEEEYEKYVGHPLNLPLVVSNEAPVIDDPTALEFVEYLDMTEGGTQPAQPDQYSDSESFYYTPALLPKLDTDIYKYGRADPDVSSIRSFPMSIARPTSSASLSYPLTPFSHPSGYTHHQHKAFAHHHFHHLYPDDQSVHDVNDPALAAPAVGGKFQTPEQDIEEFEEFLKVKENPLDVEEEDGAKKRYKAYRQWLRGKSFFKQSKVDPEWQNQLPVR